MSADDQLAELRAARDHARARLNTRIARNRALATPAGLAKRVKQDIAHQARQAAVQAIEIAADNRGVVAATASALLLWAMRKQALSGVVSLFTAWEARKNSPPEPKDDPA